LARLAQLRFERDVARTNQILASSRAEEAFLLIANGASREAAATRRVLSKAVVWFM
jgi:hypothetical protein